MRIGRAVRDVIGTFAIVVSAACGETPAAAPPAASPGTDAAVADTAPEADTPAAIDTGSVPAGAVAAEPMLVSIKVLVAGTQQAAQLKGVVLHPAVCTDLAPCPLVVVVGDYDGDAFPSYQEPAAKMAAALPANVVIFNLPGLGQGSKRSEGEDDAGGLWHESAVKEVMHLLSARKYVDKTRTGYLTIGSGLVPVTSALKTYGSGALSKVQFLIDVEGPTDRCAMSQAPEDKAKGVGPGDGAGASDSACKFDSFSPHSAMYPAAKDGKPASIVCSEAAWPITKVKSEADCPKDELPCNCASSWWAKREPRKSMNGLTQRYQRLQFKHDHRLPSYWSSRHAFAAMGNKSKFYALNNLPPCESLPDDADCATFGCWLAGSHGNGLPPAPFAGTDLQAVSVDSLFAAILPGYVKRVTDEKAFPNCK